MMKASHKAAAGDGASLWVVIYHYVRDLPRSPFPRIKGRLTDDFRRQVDGLAGRFEMATLESAVAFLGGAYRPRRDLCLLTFDDGLRDHYTDVTPILAERRIPGLFFVPTACLEELRVAAVHKNHFLAAALDLPDYRRAFLARLAEMYPGVDTAVDGAEARANYRWDSEEAAAFKYLLNFRLPAAQRCRVLDSLFRDYLGDEAEFARRLYLSWEEAREMQACGMVIGGHSHRHEALATLDDEAQRRDLETCAALLRDRLRPQALWPFSYPFGQPASSFTPLTARVIRDLGFHCAFTTEAGTNAAGEDLFALRRLDTNDLALG